METETISLFDLISNGDVCCDIQGNDVEHVYEDICNKAKLPSGVDKELVKVELMEREKILSTAVGEGYAIPHPRKQVIQDNKDQCVIICYLEKDLDMHAPDARNVNTMFVLLTTSNKFHLQALSAIAAMTRDPEIKVALENRASKEEILEILNKNR